MKQLNLADGGDHLVEHHRCVDLQAHGLLRLVEQAARVVEASQGQTNDSVDHSKVFLLQ